MGLSFEALYFRISGDNPCYVLIQIFLPAQAVLFFVWILKLPCFFPSPLHPPEKILLV